VTESADLSEISGPGPNLAQVDPPHPFKAAIKTIVIAAIVMCIAIGLYVYLGQRPPVAAGEVLAPLARQCGTDHERFRAELSIGAEADALDPRAEAITLLTLHGAKGLEFDVVFLAGCERGLLPLRLPGSGPLTPAEAAEERRLLFVGMTRARSRLLLSYAAPRGPSPFLSAIDPALLSRTQVAKRPAPDRQLRLL